MTVTWRDGAALFGCSRCGHEAVIDQDRPFTPQVLIVAEYACCANVESLGVGPAAGALSRGR